LSGKRELKITSSRKGGKGASGKAGIPQIEKKPLRGGCLDEQVGQGCGGKVLLVHNAREAAIKKSGGGGGV